MERPQYTASQRILGVRRMNILPKLQKAIGAFNWTDLRAHFLASPPDKRCDEIELVLDVILRDGYLILRVPNPKRWPAAILS